jgi:hypothetical protein
VLSKTIQSPSISLYVLLKKKVLKKIISENKVARKTHHIVTIQQPLPPNLYPKS